MRYWQADQVVILTAMLRIETRTRVLGHRLAHAGLLAGLLLLPACGGSPTAPTPPPVSTVPTVAGIAPASGVTAGGTTVTITGTNFAFGATVTIGGVPATGVTFASSSSLTGTTGPHAAGSADVVVTVGGASGSLAGGFTYVVPPANPLPVITSLTVQGTGINEPANFADLDEDVAVTATVTDAETPIGQLTFEWSADAGTITGTGPAVRWRAPKDIRTPALMAIRLRVTEVVAAIVGATPRAVLTQSVSASTTVSVHNSVKEIGDMSVQFLLDFSNSSLAPAYVVRDFWDGCAGKSEELSDVQNNRTLFVIQTYRISEPTMSIVAFKGTCAFRNRKGDGCAAVPTEWHSMFKATGKTETTIGTDYLSVVYRDTRWWLCDSDFSGKTTNPFLPAFMK